MKIIEVDEELYQYIAEHTQSIDESASDILRRLLHLSASAMVTQETNREPVSYAVEGHVNDKQSAVENPPVFTAVQSYPHNDFAAPFKAPSAQQSEEVVQQISAKVRQLLQSEQFQQENRGVIRFLNLLSVLYRTNPESFAKATEQETSQGRTRTYYARDEATLLAAGNHTKPKQIPDTPYWVITNTNSGRKMLMLERAMQFMHLPTELINEVRPYFVAN